MDAMTTSFGEVLLWSFWFFIWLCALMVWLRCVIHLFQDDSLSGWAKAGWVVETITNLINELVTAHGSAGFAESAAIQRIWRDHLDRLRLRAGDRQHQAAALPALRVLPVLTSPRHPPRIG